MFFKESTFFETIILGIHLSLVFLDVAIRSMSMSELSRLELGTMEHPYPWRIHGDNCIFTDPWMDDCYGFHVGKYTSPIDAMG